MKRIIRHNKIKRNLSTYLHGTTFMSLEQAIKHYMSDGVVNLPQAPEGAFEYEVSPAPDDLRGTADASFDRLDFAAQFAKDFMNVKPNDVPKSSSSSEPSTTPSPASSEAAPPSSD